MFVLIFMGVKTFMIPKETCTTVLSPPMVEIEILARPFDLCDGCNHCGRTIEKIENTHTLWHHSEVQEVRK